jgi:ElaB/YqjD/DUF883 family membrane-anchored ribosome-binding protein
MTDQARTEPRTPQQIRHDIEETREELGETAAALAEKADVKAQAKAKVEEKRKELRAKVGEKREELRTRAAGARGAADQRNPDSADSTGAQAQVAVSQVASTARERPVPFAATAGFAGGLLLGWLLGRR